MRFPTPSQLARSKTLIAEHLRLRQQNRSLHALVAAAQARADVANRTRAERLDLVMTPGNCAGLVELRRRNAALAADIRRAYDRLLTRLLEGDGFTPHSRPVTLDYHALKSGARPYLAPAFVNLVVGGKLPYLDLERSDPANGRLVYVHTAGPCPHTLWAQHLPTISDYLGANYEITAATVNSITLTRRTPLPTVIPFEVRMIKPEHLFVGINVATRQPHHVRLTDLSHLLVTGTTGMGKSVALDMILRSVLASPIEHVTAVDPAGIAFGKYAGTHPRLTTLSAPSALHAVTADLVRLMQAREIELQKKRKARFEDRWRVLIIDEFPAYATPENPDSKSDEVKAHKQFMAHLMTLGRRARKSGIKLILVTQEPTDRDIPTGLRSVLPGLIAFRPQIDTHATSLFGKLENLPADPRTLPRGRALYRDGTTSEIVQVQFPVVT